MKNAFSRAGRTCASVLFGGGLLAAALFAASPNTLTVTLPHAVTVGSATLPIGQYTISGMEMSDGNEYFVVRGAQTAPVTLQARRIDATDGGKTQDFFEGRRIVAFREIVSRRQRSRLRI